MIKIEESTQQRLLIFTDAATSAKLHVSVGVFFCMAATDLQNYAALTTMQLTEDVNQKIVYKKFESKKSTGSEIQTVIEALLYIKEQALPFHHIELYTDCQSVCDLLGRRKANLQKNNFITRAGKIHPNAPLYKILYALTEQFHIETFKIKGHAPSAERITLQQRIFDVVDKLSRDKLRRYANH